MAGVQWAVDCGSDPPVNGWQRRGGATTACITGRCPGSMGINISGGSNWGMRWPLGYLELNVGYSGIYAQIPVLDGNPATLYGIINYTYPGAFNWENAPAVGITVHGDGSISVAKDSGDFFRTAAGIIVAGTNYFYELKALCSTIVGTTEVRLDGVVVSALSGSGLNTTSAQNTVDGFNYIGIGAANNVYFYDFYFNTTGYQGPTACGTQFAGVTGFTHSLVNGTLRTEVEIGGLPKGGYRRWLPLGQLRTLRPPINVPPEPPVDGGVVAGALSEVVTIAAAAFTDTTIQIPAGAVVYAVSVRVMLPIPAPTTSFSVGTAANTTRFSTANVGTTLGSTDPGTAAAVGYTATASAIRLTMNGGNPGAATGQVRVSISYITAG